MNNSIMKQECTLLFFKSREEARSVSSTSPTAHIITVIMQIPNKMNMLITIVMMFAIKIPIVLPDSVSWPMGSFAICQSSRTPSFSFSFFSTARVFFRS